MAEILLVEDAELVRFALSTLLKESGHRVTEVGNGHAAMTAVRDSRFDIVVTDIYMPEMDGIKLIRHLREALPDAKVMAITGGGARQQPDYAIDMASKLGADVTMQKPVDNETFLANVNWLARGAT
ncbi:MAG: response regulator [Kiloniellales bacterium]|nr:response regulator [Kiloniellales bacterium]